MDLTERAKERQEHWRRLVAQLKERGAVILSSVPERVAEFRRDSTARSPCQLLNHINGRLADLLQLLTRSERTGISPAAWGTEVERFFDAIEQLDSAIVGAPNIHAELLSHASHGLGTCLGDALIGLGRIERVRAAAGSPAEEIDDSGNKESGAGPRASI